MSCHQQSQLLVRLPQPAKEWLKSRAADNARSVNAEILQIVKTMMNAEPLYCVVRHCKFGSDEVFTAALGESTATFSLAPGRKMPSPQPAPSSANSVSTGPQLNTAKKRTEALTSICKEYQKWPKTCTPYPLPLTMTATMECVT
jgi:hypothetical protein